MGQVDEHHVAGGAFDEGADRGLVVLPDDQIPLPMPGHGPVVDLGGALADQDHGGRHPLHPLRPAAPPANRPSSTQDSSDLAVQFAMALLVEGRIDHFVAHVHLRMVGEVPAQPAHYLFRTPPDVQIFLHHLP
ncbi:hypothetical protein DEU38_1352 [Rhodococcus sp. AG1013]|nr:hypothetical protein DEU38_1352 [Rhodococcus sp. AG1013]